MFNNQLISFLRFFRHGHGFRIKTSHKTLGKHNKKKRDYESLAIPAQQDPQRHRQLTDPWRYRQIRDGLRRVRVKLLSRAKRSQGAANQKLCSHCWAQVKVKGNLEVRVAARSWTSPKRLCSIIHGPFTLVHIVVIEPFLLQCTKRYILRSGIKRSCLLTKSRWRYLCSLKEVLSFPWWPRAI